MHPWRCRRELRRTFALRYAFLYREGLQVYMRGRNTSGRMMLSECGRDGWSQAANASVYNYATTQDRRLYHSFRHSKMTNVAFCDLHVETKKYDDVAKNIDNDPHNYYKEY